MIEVQRLLGTKPQVKVASTYNDKDEYAMYLSVSHVAPTMKGKTESHVFIGLTSDDLIGLRACLDEVLEGSD